VSEKTSHAVRGADDTGEVIGAEFTGVLHAAQQGRVAAFVRLWSDVNPALNRYLRVVAVADADDIACESWVAVLRRLPTFEGDETAWRTLVFSCARMHAEDENQRRVWDAMVEDAEVTAVVAVPLPPGEEPFEEDEAEGGPAHGLRMALEAVRDLPPEQGEVLMLRQVGLLPAEEVATLVGSDVGAVRALEQEALDQLGLDAELLAWSIGVEPRPVELSDEAALVAVFRTLVPEQSTSSPTSSRGAVSPGGARVISLRRPTWRTRAGAAAAASAAVLGMGAFSAAAYQGVLPDPVQNVMHVVIGAPEPAPESPAATSAAPTGRTRTTTAPARPAQAGTRSQSTSTRAGQPPMTAALDLCRTWEAERERGVTEDRSTSFRSLAQAAGGGSRVGAYCAASGVPLAPLTTGSGAVTPATPEPSATPPTTEPSATPPTTEPTPTPPTTEPTTEPTTPTTEPTTEPTTPTTGSGGGSTGAGTDTGTDTGTVGRGASTGKGRAAGTQTDDPATDTSGTVVGKGRLKG
jgi:DNA-directed RNA polymerase specialized sigma24 family protein